MLDHNTTILLLEKARLGDEESKKLLIVNNMPLIKSIAKRYRNRNIEYDDLLQLGALGIVKAINNFDVTYNVKFSTYAVPMIAGEIKRFIRDDGVIKVSRVLKTLCSKIGQFVNEFCQSHDCQPTIKEIAEHFEIDQQEVVFALDSNKYPVSLYEKFDDESNQCILDKIPNKENNEDIVDRIILKDIILALPEREKKIIILRYFRDKTQSEIAKMLGVSQVQISRIESKVLEIFKKALS
ncbi:MAG: SigB/SigF/SigG family RNA polymerase sigma factor [Clostridia bacterium]